jgi:transposase
MIRLRILRCVQSGLHCTVVRARIILMASQGMSNEIIAARLDTQRQIVSKWRKRFYLARLPGLQNLPRGGRRSRRSPGRPG